MTSSGGKNRFACVFISESRKNTQSGVGTERRHRNVSEKTSRQRFKPCVINTKALQWVEMRLDTSFAENIMESGYCVLWGVNILQEQLSSSGLFWKPTVAFQSRLVSRGLMNLLFSHYWRNIWLLLSRQKFLRNNKKNLFIPVYLFSHSIIFRFPKLQSKLWADRRGFDLFLLGDDQNWVMS